MNGTALVVGGGPAGAMLAAGLAARGGRVTLLERSTGPHHKICGEFLSWEARALLAAQGAALPPGAPIDRLAIVSGGRRREARLPGEAMGISRHALDEALLLHAAGRGANIRRGAAAQAWEGGGVRLKSGERLSADRLYLATGKTDLRGAARAPGAGVTSDLTGFKLHLRLAPADAAALGRTIELHHFAGGYAGLQPIEAGRFNLCLLVETSSGWGWDDVRQHLRRAAPRLAARLDAAVPLYERPLAISRVPYGYRRPAGTITAVGDQNAVIHSFTGDGLALAIGSGALAGAFAGSDVQLRRALSRFAAPPVRRAAAIYRLLATRPALLAAAAAVPGAARLLARATRAKMPQLTSL